MAQWIRHRPTEPGIAGSSPAGVIWAIAELRLAGLRCTLVERAGVLRSTRGGRVCHLEAAIQVFNYKFGQVSQQLVPAWSNG